MHSHDSRCQRVTHQNSPTHYTHITQHTHQQINHNAVKDALKRCEEFHQANTRCGHELRIGGRLSVRLQSVLCVKDLKHASAIRCVLLMCCDLLRLSRVLECARNLCMRLYVIAIVYVVWLCVVVGCMGSKNSCKELHVGGHVTACSRRSRVLHSEVYMYTRCLRLGHLRSWRSLASMKPQRGSKHGGACGGRGRSIQS